MSQRLLRRVAADLLRGHRLAAKPGEQRSCSGATDCDYPPFDESLLEFLVCPLSKKPLRYDEKSNELINEELGIAYPIIHGIPNMIPQDARMIRKSPEQPLDP